MRGIAGTVETTPNLNALLTGVLGEGESRSEITALVRVAHRMAIAYLEHKRRSGTLRPESFGLTLEDLALDCVGDLFERNDEGEFSQIVQYFHGSGWEDMDEAALTSWLRRLVLGKVTESLSRRYRENDPNLARCIRSLKDAVRASDRADIELGGVDRWVVFTSLEAERDTLPLAPPELLEAFLANRLGTNVEMPCVLRLVAFFLRDHCAYRRGYPLVSLARVVHAATVRLGASEMEAQTPAAEPPLLPIEGVEQVVRAAVDELKHRMHRSYVGRGKVDERWFSAYILSVREILRIELGVHDADQMTYFDVMRFFVHDLTEEIYTSTHRNRLEYLVKLGRSATIQRLRLAL